MFRDLTHLQYIVYEVDVVSATGLSSERTWPIEELESNSHLEETHC